MSSVKDSLEFLLARVGRAHHNLVRQSLEKTGLHRGQPPLLFALSEHDGMTHSQLSAEMEVSPAAISNMVKRMEKAGFVVRRRDTDDERVSRVYLTDAGRAVYSEIGAIAEQVDETTFVGFTKEERTIMRDFLDRVLDNLKQAAK
jgi:DNA-binding MarR family transcriptional regulator